MFPRYLKNLILKHPKLSKKMYIFCKNYIDTLNGDNNHNISTNGELRLMSKLLPISNTVFDIGANVGEWSKLALSINPNISLHCFEPCLEAYEKLSRNNFPSNVILNKTGLSSQNKKAEIYTFEDTPSLNSLYQRKGLEDLGIKEPNTTESIALEKLDDYCKKHNVDKIDFIKIDVEGHELEVLKGSETLLEKNKIQFVQFEYGGCYIDSRTLLKDIFCFFQSLDYDLCKILPMEIKRVSTYSQNLENFQLQNWLAINKSNKPALRLLNLL